LGLTWGWLVARIGCFFAHDHKGSLSDFFLAVDFPDGARHDLGLYDAILSLIILGVLIGLWKRRPRYGMMGGVTCVMYAVVRFFLDNLRSVDLASSDARYLGLTPAQFGCFALCVFGAWMIWRSRHEPVIGEADTA
jgi:phosphatidylglycerol:prolipoprotein diacylglycerol transferase